MLRSAPSLADQVYDALVEEICDGRLPPGAHLVQERLAEKFGISRQPVQQAMNRLRADGMVQELGRRGLFVTRLHPDMVRHHYGARSALDGWAAKQAALRVAEDRALKAELTANGTRLMEAARAAIAAAQVDELARLDDRFHALIYEASGNPLIADTAAPHWRFLRRAIGDVLRKASTPGVVWAEHQEMLDLILRGDGAAAALAAEAHAANAARLLSEALSA